VNDADTYARAKEIFLEASLLARGERTRFLNARCRDDAALKGHVRRLLTLDAEDAGFLELSAVETSAPDVGAGARLGSFRVVRRLGEGGMGIVYEAVQDEPERRVALKLVRLGHFSERLRARFRHEIRVLGYLRHPGIAQIYEAGTLAYAGEHVPYFAMELIEGEPLTRVAARIGLRERLALVAQICDAVHHAHQKGVIHRDLKPGNILVEAAPTGAETHETGTSLPFQVKVLDFGVARAIDTDITPASAHTQAGQLIGTLPYMSPEQAAGDADAVDIRSDVYSIGVIACEVLAGRLPYEVVGKPLPEAARVIREQAPLRLSLVDRSLRGDVETIVSKALQKDRRARYQSAAEMGADIRRYLRNEPIVARAPTALYQLRKFARRHRPLVGAAALAAVALVAATVVSAWQGRIAGRARVFAEGEQVRADLAASAALREADRARLAGAAAAISSGDPITATRLLEGTAEGGRGWAWRYWRARLDEAASVVRVEGPIAAVWMSDGGDDLTAVSEDGVVYRGSAWSGELSEVVRLEAPVQIGALFDRGRRLITADADQRTLAVFDVVSGERLTGQQLAEGPLSLLGVSDDGGVVAAGPRRPGRSPADVFWLLRGAAPRGREAIGASIPRGTSCAAMTPDGRWLAMGMGNEGVMVWDTREQGPREFARLARGAQTIAISADGSRIAAGGVDKTIGLWDRATGALVHSFTGHTGAVTALAFDPAGDVLASAGVDLTIRLWDTVAGKAITTFVGQTGPIEQRQFVGPAGPVAQLQFSADGSLLMSASRDGTIRLWRREPFEGTCILRGHTSYVYAVAFTPDGASILSGAWDETLRSWDSADGSPRGAAASGCGIVTAVGVSRDGSLIATGQNELGTGGGPSVLLWDAGTRRPICEPVRMSGEIGDVVFSADGTRVYACHGIGGVTEVDVATRPPTALTIVKAGTPVSLALAPEGSELACGDADGSIAIVSAASGGVLRRLTGHTGQVRGVAFHPLGRRLASASDDGSARVWDLDSGRAIELRGHADKVYAVAFSPDGRVLATGSEDTTIVLWDGESGEELTRLRGHDAYVYSLEFSPDGMMLVSGSGDHTVRVWDTRPVRHRWMRQASQRGVPAFEGGF